MENTILHEHNYKKEVNMIKLLVVTHGPLAAALKESAAMFFGDATENITTLGLFPTDGPEALQEKISESVKNIDDGDGVMIFVDIFAGSPFNMTALSIDELKENHKLECFTGVNMPILMEALSSCESMDIVSLRQHLNSVSKDTIVDLRQALEI